jgi:transcription-repair coupling factor (superfamily II helicase)
VTPTPSPPAPWWERLRAFPALDPLRARLAGPEALRLSGLAGTARLVLPLLLTDTPLLVVVPQEKHIEPAGDDLATLVAEAGQAGAVLAFPSPGPALRGLPRHPEASLRRAAVLHAAARGRVKAVVASPAGLLRPSLRRELFETRILSLQSGEDLIPEMLLEALEEGGYRREDPVVAPGQFARRGGVLDLFPPDTPQPVRLEFFGDTLESIRRFDPDTQRTTAVLEGLEVGPLSDTFAPRSVLERLPAALRDRFAGRPELDQLLARLGGLGGEGRALPGPHGMDELADLLTLVPGVTVPLWDHLPGLVPVVLDPEEVERASQALHEQAEEEGGRHPERLTPAREEVLLPVRALLARLRAVPSMHLLEVDPDGTAIPVSSRPVRRWAGDLRGLVGDLRGSTLHATLLLGSAGRAERMRELLFEEGLALGEGQALDVRVGALSTGFELPDAGQRLLADGDVFPEEVHLHARARGRRARSFLSDFRDLKVGDLVVHQDHGIGRFEGLQTLELGHTRQEFMVLAYQGGDKLKVPVESFDRIQKYSSVEGGARPALDKMGGPRWEKVKRRVKKAMRDMAAELLKLYAERKARPGHAFATDSPWLREFEETFEYEETPDQAAAIGDVGRDMSEEAPMDRLICGDVGYGKTEVAMRAAMRAVLDGKQVALLTPTTVLAFQHWKTLRKRFAPFPVRVEMVSRFRAPGEIKQVLADARAGKVDILIGTHRLLSKDVAFADLGLLVIDEEQRFGVQAKERLKHLRRTVDCLTLSATPIPRTLQMGLSGIRDMSVIETPPKDRLAIQTSIVKFSTETITNAIRQELLREGQVFFVHNRVESIWSVASLAQRLVPEARVVVAHGQMGEAELERNMLAFVEGRADVLVATTLIENGLDIPRANTLIVNRADRYGLAQLYQLRGRVGRSDRPAYAWLMVPPDVVLSEIARKRLAAIRDFSELGAGFRIAALDLELRGAGNLLGGEQSGHIHAVGLEMYVKLLEQTILELRGQAAPEMPRAALNLRLDMRLPEDYVPEVHQRLSLYKRLSQARGEDEVAALRAEVRDRYGAPPPGVDDLLRWAELRVRAEALAVTQVDLAAGALQLRFAADPGLDASKLQALARRWRGATLTPQGVLRLPVPPGTASLAALGEALEALEGRTLGLARAGL